MFHHSISISMDPQFEVIDVPRTSEWAVEEFYYLLHPTASKFYTYHTSANGDVKAPIPMPYVCLCMALPTLKVIFCISSSNAFHTCRSLASYLSRKGQGAIFPQGALSWIYYFPPSFFHMIYACSYPLPCFPWTI